MTPSAALPGEGSAAKTSALDVVQRLILSVTYIGASGAMVCFNKYLMSRGRFPYAMALPAIHMAFNSAVCAILYCLRPAWFPGMANAEGSRMRILSWFVPMGTCFAVSLCATNEAYMHLSVACVQFLKETNVGIIFTVSCLVGLQQFTAPRVAVIAWIIFGACTSVTGDVKFVWAGVIVQVFGQLADCSRVVMAEIVLRGGGLNLDPLSYMLFSSPVCLLVLAVANFIGWDSVVLLALREWWPQVLLNTLMAFILNALLPVILKEISAIGMTLCGVCKDVAIVVLSSVAFGAPLTHHQIMAFAFTMAGVLLWSVMHSSSESHKRLLLLTRTSGKPDQPDETTALVA